MSLYQLYPQPKFPVDNQTAAVGVASASLTVRPGVVYRIITTVDTYIKLSKGAATATSADIVLSAGEKVVWLANGWDTISFLRVTGTSGSISVTEVINPV